MSKASSVVASVTQRCKQRVPQSQTECQEIQLTKLLQCSGRCGHIASSIVESYVLKAVCFFSTICTNGVISTSEVTRQPMRHYAATFDGK